MVGERACRAQISGLIVLLLVLCCAAAAPLKKKAPDAAPKPKAQALSAVKNTDVDSRIESQRQQLDSIKAELQRGRSRVEELKKVESSHLSLIEQLDRNIALSRTYISRLEQRIDSLNVSIDTLSTALKKSQNDLVDRQGRMRLRLRNLYKARPDPLWFVAQFDLSRLLHRVRYFQAVNRYDRNLIAAIDSTRKAIDARKQMLEQTRSSLLAMHNAKVSEQASLSIERRSREGLLAVVRAQKESYLNTIKDLQSAQAQLDGIIKLLLKQREKEKARAKESEKAKKPVIVQGRRARLPWPVDGPVVTPFGRVVHPVYKTATINNGIDIAAKAGTRVACIASGKVVHVGIMRGLGKLTIIDHGAYWTIYARLGDIYVRLGEAVTAGAVVGTVAESGTYESARMHFEIYESSVPVNPMEWLKPRE